MKEKKDTESFKRVGRKPGIRRGSIPLLLTFFHLNPNKMQFEENVRTTGTIFCKDGTVRVVKGFLKNYAEFGRAVEGENYRTSTTDTGEHKTLEKVMPLKRTKDELEVLKAEKKAFKQRQLLTYPELAAQGLSAEQIWNKTCGKGEPTN